MITKGSTEQLTNERGHVARSDSVEMPITISPMKECDIPDICSWVLSTEQLRMISGDVAQSLTKDILLRWWEEAIDAVTIRYQSYAVGFCTLSDAEYEYPKGHVELCHFVIAPQFRRRYFGNALLGYMRLLAAHRGFKILHGRIAPENYGGLPFAKYVHWVPDTSTFLASNFNWFGYELREFKAINS